MFYQKRVVSTKLDIYVFNVGRWSHTTVVRSDPTYFKQYRTN